MLYKDLLTHAYSSIVNSYQNVKQNKNMCSSIDGWVNNSQETSV